MALFASPGKLEEYSSQLPGCNRSARSRLIEQNEGILTPMAKTCHLTLVPSKMAPFRFSLGRSGQNSGRKSWNKAHPQRNASCFCPFAFPFLVTLRWVPAKHPHPQPFGKLRCAGAARSRRSWRSWRRAEPLRSRGRREGAALASPESPDR